MFVVEMSVVALSPMSPEPPSPMVTSVTPLDPSSNGKELYQDQDQNETSEPGQGPSRGTLTGQDSRRSRKPPPLHTGADWKVVLHLPEIEKWLRATSDRVTQLSHSVSQDRDTRHVDTHLLQLKDICEDISDHVEQIHALLETEFSLKLLSYSVNIIVDIRTVQLLWHQLRVSVLVLKERLLQGLQDSNGNFTRQTDILQAFSHDQSQDRLDALTEVDDCGQLTIRCSQDYFSLDCGITAFELSDYSPSEEVRETPEEKTQKEEDNESENTGKTDQKVPALTTERDTVNENQLLPTIQCGCESVKRPLTRGCRSTEVSPTHPSLPKRAALSSDPGGTRAEEGKGERVDPISRLQTRAELSGSSPYLMEPPEKNRFWLELDAVYPEHSSDHLQNSSRATGGSQPALPDQRSSSGGRGSADNHPFLRDEPSGRESHAHSRGDSDSPLTSPTTGYTFSSDPDASAEESRPSSSEPWVLKRTTHKGVHVSSKSSPHREHWFGSEEFLALPAQLRKTEMLAMNLESLAKSVPLGSGRCDPSHDALQDVDDWDLTELNAEWDGLESGDNGSSLGESVDDPSPLPTQQLLFRRQLFPRRFSPSSSSDMAPSSLDESLESGRLSELQSEDEGPAVNRGVTGPPVDRAGRTALVQKLLEHIQRQDQDPLVWTKIESLVQKLDGFIAWLQEALDSTENWTQPRQDLDSLRVYLDTHLSFKLNVDSRSSLKDGIMEEGRTLLNSITSHQSALRDILQMVLLQWDQLQRQIRRQHGWMLRALRCIQARLFYTGQSHEAITVSTVPSTNPTAAHSTEGLKVELISSQFEVQRAALEQMAVRLSSLQYNTSTNRRSCAQTARTNSLLELEAECQDLWDWLMDMDAMVTDSHQLMMSEEQRHHLFKSSHTELQMMEPRRTALLARVEALKRSSCEVPRDLNQKLHDLNQTWDQLKKILSEHSGPGPVRSLASSLLLSVGVSSDCSRSALSPLTNSLLEQLEARIKELKSWLRDTELLIFNSCLRNDKDAAEQLSSFKSLCSEIRARRRGVSSVLKLCQKLLQQNQSSPTAELGPEAQQHQEALQLLSINLERRWEAIVMQALQWQNRLKRELGDEQVPGNFLEPGLVDLHQITSVQTGTTGITTDDSWEWDETDMTISETKEDPQEPDLTHDLPTQNSFTPDGNQPNGIQTKGNNNVYQVYSLHDVELYEQPQFPHSSLKNKAGKYKLLTKTLSKDSSFSSVESLPDILGGIMKRKQGIWEGKGKDGREGGWSVNSGRSESESGIDTGDTETANSEIQDRDEFEEQVYEEKTIEKDRGKFEKKENSEAVKGNEPGFSIDDTERIMDYLSERSKEDDRKKRHRKCAGEAVEILINGRGILTPADSDSDFEYESTKPFQELNIEQKSGLENHFSPVLSHGSSLESLLTLGGELFPIHCSASLASGLVPNRSFEGEVEGGEGGDVEMEPKEEVVEIENQRSAGELSRRTLDLLKRLENIQSPLAGKMTRSVSDMALRSLSPNRIPVSPSLGGKLSPLSGISLRLSPPSLINESSANASLTELSSAEDSSVASDDFNARKDKRQVFLDPDSAANGNFYVKKHGNRIDEVDGASLSMVVNVSSACTDDDDDDSDLLSSSTLTEEELGIRDEQEERFSATSSANEDDFEGSFGLDYMQRELQNWIRAPFSKSEAGLKDELQCGSNLHNNENAEHTFLNSSRFIEMSTKHSHNKDAEEENLRSVTRSYISQFVDDVENGNVDQSCLKSKDEDDELLREESSVFTKKGETLREPYVFGKSEEIRQNMSEFFPQSEAKHQDSNVSKRPSHLVGQLKGELPCHNSIMPSPPSPIQDSSSHDAFPTTNGRKAITIQEQFKFMSLVTEQTKREVRDREVQTKRRHGAHCCSHHPSGFQFVDEENKASEENVHSFVMEIIDMTASVRRNKETEESMQMELKTEHSPASFTQLRDKVLEHSHRPVHLRKGDFYSYLSLSSHDSDCGEVLQRLEDKTSSPSNNTPTPGLNTPSPEPFTEPQNSKPNQDLDRETPADDKLTSPTSVPPQSPDIRDEETLFAACTEEVYLGPPLCYSMALPKKQRKVLQKENLSERLGYLPNSKANEDFTATKADYELDKSVFVLCSKPVQSLTFESGNRRDVSYLTVLEGDEKTSPSLYDSEEPIDRSNLRVSGQSSHLYSLEAGSRLQFED